MSRLFSTAGLEFLEYYGYFFRCCNTRKRVCKRLILIQKEDATIPSLGLNQKAPRIVLNAS